MTDDDGVFGPRSRGSVVIGEWSGFGFAWAASAAAGWLCYFKIRHLAPGTDLAPVIAIVVGGAAVVSWGGVFAVVNRSGPPFVRDLCRTAGMFVLGTGAGVLVGGLAGVVTRLTR